MVAQVFHVAFYVARSVPAPKSSLGRKGVLRCMYIKANTLSRIISIAHVYDTNGVSLVGGGGGGRKGYSKLIMERSSSITCSDY